MLVIPSNQFGGMRTIFSTNMRSDPLALDIDCLNSGMRVAARLLPGRLYLIARSAALQILQKAKSSCALRGLDELLLNRFSPHAEVKSFLRRVMI